MVQQIICYSPASPSNRSGSESVRTTPLWYNRSSATVLPPLQAAREANLARPHPCGTTDHLLQSYLPFKPLGKRIWPDHTLVVQQIICYSPTSPSSRSGSESGQTTPLWYNRSSATVLPPLQAAREANLQTTPLWYNRSSATVLPPLQAAREANLARPHPCGTTDHLLQSKLPPIQVAEEANLARPHLYRGSQ